MITVALCLVATSCVPPTAIGNRIAIARAPAHAITILLPPPLPFEESVALASAPARPFDITKAPSAERRRSLDCLTAAIYYEARSESEAGQQAVAQVVLNRVRHPAFPASVCAVVYQGAARRTGCQFSFTCDGSLRRSRIAWAWTRARDIAEQALAGRVFSPVGYATHYHAGYVSPYWAGGLTRAATVGAHIFYRWKGASGAAPAFVQSYRAALVTAARPKAVVKALLRREPTNIALPSATSIAAAVPEAEQSFPIEQAPTFEPAAMAASPALPSDEPALD